MAGRFQEAQDAVAEADFVAIVDRDVRKLGARLRAQVDGGAGEGGQFGVAGDEIGVQVGLDHVLDAEPVFDRVFDVDADVALRVDHRGDASGTDHVGRMRQASEIELLEVHFTPGSALFWACGWRAVKVSYHASWPYRTHFHPSPAPVRAVICPCSCCCSPAAAAPR